VSVPVLDTDLDTDINAYIDNLITCIAARIDNAA